MVRDRKQFEKLQLLHRFYTYLDIVGEDESGLIFTISLKTSQAGYDNMMNWRFIFQTIL